MFKNPLHVYGPEDVMVPVNLNAPDYILKRIYQFRDKVAWINGITDEPYTYSQLLQESMNIAVSLTHMGIRKGHVVGLCSENRIEYWSTVLGILFTGATLTPFNPGYSESELRHVLNISKPKFLFCSPTIYKKHQKLYKSLTFIDKLILFGEKTDSNLLYHNDLITAIKSNNGNALFENNRLTRNIVFDEFRVPDVLGQVDVVIILYSSGTTGLPKGVLVTHLNLLTACAMPPALDESLPGLSVTPWFHLMGLTHSLTGMTEGKTTIYLPKFDVDLYLRTIEKYKIQQLTIVPPIVVAVCKAQNNYDLSSIKVMYSGAAPLLEETIDSLKKKCPNLRGVIQGLGMTETTQAIMRGVHDKVEEFKSGSVGVVVSNCVIKIVDIETRESLGPNKPGEICVKGPMVMAGYLGADTAAAFDDEGFYKTGDVAYYDEDRHFFVVDRIKELIKYKGFQVSPVELEAVLLQHPSVADVGVVGIPNQEAGELPMAFIVKRNDVTEKEIQEFVASKLSNPKKLRGGVRFVSEIPKNPSGKILRRILKEMAKKPVSKL